MSTYREQELYLRDSNFATVTIIVSGPPSNNQDNSIVAVMRDQYPGREEFDDLSVDSNEYF